MAQKTRKRIIPQPPREEQLREDIARLLGPALLHLREWNTRVCPDCYKDVEKYPECRVLHLLHLPPLHYALVQSVSENEDMPLGMGATAEEALSDLLWTLRATEILSDLHDL